MCVYIYIRLGKVLESICPFRHISKPPDTTPVFSGSDHILSSPSRAAAQRSGGLKPKLNPILVWFQSPLT